MKRRLLTRCGLAVLVGAAIVAGVPASASAAITSVFAGQTISGGAIPCTAQFDGVRVCHGSYEGSGHDLRLKSFDGTPLDVYVILPPISSFGAAGPYPVIVQSHGWGGEAGGPNDNQYFGPTGDQWANEGFAVVELTARGLGDSCGRSSQESEPPAYYKAVCAQGYTRMDDERYEARDVQWALGLLVDEGVVAAGHIGVTGSSYGGAVSLELATLKDRIYDASTNTLEPWTSPHGTHLSVTAAAPIVSWSDLAYALMPNGRTLDYEVTSPTADLSPVGVEKQSLVQGLFEQGRATGYYAPPGVDPQDNLNDWAAALDAGEPYDSNAQAQQVITTIAQYHSPYYLLDGAYGTPVESPAPLLIANGFTDDLFPVDEAVRYYNLERSLYPSDPIQLLDGDFGHPPAQDKSGDETQLSSALQAFFEYWLKGSGSEPASGATALVETCPSSAPSGGPYTASTWAGLHPGEVDYSAAGAQTIASDAGDQSIAGALDPDDGETACETLSAADQGSGVATYRLPAASGSGYTLLGSPTVLADLNVSGDQGGSFAFVAARLWDVDPATNSETLVARGLYRIDGSNPDGFQAFQLHPGAWHFAAGDVPKLELLGQDSPYARTSNGQFSVTVSNLELRLPVHEQPGSVPGVGSPLPAGIPGPSCANRPRSRLHKRRTHASSHRLVASGTASEHPCPAAAASERKLEHVMHVYVMIYRRASHGRCRFLRRDGRFTRARPCTDPVEYLASGTTHWHLRLRITIRPGTYWIRSDAVDGYNRHQRHTAVSVQRLIVT